MKMRSKIIATTSALLILATSSVMVFADSSNNGFGFGSANSANRASIAKNTASCTQSSFTVAQRDAMFAAMSTVRTQAVTNLLADKIFSKAEADSILAKMATRDKATNGVRPNPGKGFGLELTDVQKTALQKEMTDLRTAAIAKLVSDKTITQTQADQMLTMHPGGRGDRDGDGDGFRHGMMNGNGQGQGFGKNGMMNNNSQTN